ncbi:MAG TPA: restriction endonuclease [Kouleothrix sp.]|nr:restriction endonuclease [Kouleothrix sp.]
MGVDVSEQREPQPAKAAKQRKQVEPDTPALPAITEPPKGLIARSMSLLSVGLRELNWQVVLLYGTIAGVLMSFAFLQGPTLSLIAGIVPVGTGLLLGRRVQNHYALHGFMTGLIGGIAGAVALAALIFLTPLRASVQAALGPQAATFTLLQIWGQLAGFTALSLVAFCTFGTTMAGRTEERNRKLREQVDERGGQLQRPGTIRELSDIQGLSLPQFGSYVKNVFTKQGFTFKDHRFIDKDKHLDLWFEHEGEPWHLRLSVADKVGVGTIESLLQDMKREGCRKGVVVVSTEFQPNAAKTARGRPVVLIDGQTLFDMAEK